MSSSDRVTRAGSSARPRVAPGRGPEAALRAARAGTWHFDSLSGRLEVSPQMQRLVDLDPSTETLDIRAIEGVMEPEERARLESEVRDALTRDGAISIEVRVQSPEGRLRWLQISGAVRSDGAGNGTWHGSGIAWDISDRKLAERRLTVRDRVAHIIADADTLDAAVPQVLATIARGVGMDFCGLWLPAASDGSLRGAYGQGAEPDGGFERLRRHLQETRFRPGEGLLGRVWQAREARWVESLSHDADIGALDGTLVDGLASGGAVPLMAGSEAIGVIGAFTRQPTSRDDETLETLRGLGHILVRFVLRVRAESELLAQDARERVRVAILQAHRDAAGPDSAVTASAEALGRHLGASRAGFVEFDGDVVTMLPDWADTGLDELPDTWSTRLLPSAQLARLRAGHAVVVSDVRADPNYSTRRPVDLGVRSIIAIPIVRQGHLHAGLYVTAATVRQWTPTEIRLAHETADLTWDTIERLRSERAQRETDVMAHTIADNSTQAMLLMDRRGYVRYANAACLALTAFEGEDICERPLHELIHHHHADGRPFPRSACPIERVLPERTKLRDYETVMFRKDGSKFPALCSASPVFRAGERSTTVVEIQDVSASRAAALALARSEQRFRSTFDNAAVGVAHVALDGRWLRVNRRLCEIVQYDEDELLTRTFGDITHPDDLDTDLAQTRRILAGEIDTYALEKRYLRKDGSEVWVELTVSLARDDGDRPEYFIAVVSDASARKHAESRLRTALAVKNEFLGLVSHEIRTPMTVIEGMSEILASGTVQADLARSVARDIADAAHELDELIESMLLLARLDRDEEAMREPIVLGRIAADSIERQQRRDAGRRYRLVEAGGAIVDANPGLIDRVITNLLVNAAKYSAPREDIEVVVEADDREVRLHVLDAGPGLSDDELKQVFEPFYRTPSASGASGAGLGLSVVSRIVESLGGRRWATRTERGSDFGFAIPRLEPEEE